MSGPAPTRSRAMSGISAWTAMAARPNTHPRSQDVADCRRHGDIADAGRHRDRPASPAGVCRADDPVSNEREPGSVRYS